MQQVESLLSVGRRPAISLQLQHWRGLHGRSEDQHMLASSRRALLRVGHAVIRDWIVLLVLTGQLPRPCGGGVLLRSRGHLTDL